MLDTKLVAEKPEDVGVDSEALDALFARAQRDVDDGTLPSAQVAVARNSEIVPRSEFEAVRIEDGDRIEIVQAIGGGCGESRGNWLNNH